MPAFEAVCPNCRHSHRQTKAGLAVNGNQRYQCQDCKRYYAQENRRFRYPANLRAQAVEMFERGLPCRQVARLLAINHQTIANWIADGKKSFPGEAPVIRARAF